MVNQAEQQPHVMEIHRLWPTILTGVMGNSVIYVTPLLIGGMVTDRGFSEQQAGFMASADLAGYAIATFFTAFVLHRFRWRTMAYVALAIMISANIATTFVHDVVPFAEIRFLSGVGGGILAAIATVSLGHTENPDRNYGLLFAASLLFGTAGLWGLPVLLERTGLNGGYVLIAGLALLVALVAHRLPADFARRDPVVTRATRVHWFLAAAMLAAIALFWAQQNALYAYLERIGNASTLSGQYIGLVLGAANLTGFVGAALVASIGGRLSRTMPLVLAIVVQLLCLWSLRGRVTPAGYLVAVGSMSLAWNIVNPLQLGILAEVDRDGRALALSATVIGIGLAAGPALAAMTVGGGSYTGILWLATGLTMFSLLLMIPALRRR